jgi:hypothetical protein
MNVPMGSTRKVGESVRGGRVPEEYDSSPTLYNKRLGERKKEDTSSLDRKGRSGTNTLTSESADTRARSRPGRAPLL